MYIVLYLSIVNNQFFEEFMCRTRVVTSYCLPVTNLILVQECTNPGSVIVLTVAHYIFSIILFFSAYKHVCHCMRTRQKWPAVRCTGHAQSVGLQSAKCLRVAFLAPRIWKWFIGFWKICGPQRPRECIGSDRWPSDSCCFSWT
jgi:hypothetical protein